MTETRSVPELVRVAAVLVAIWTLFAMYEASTVYSLTSNNSLEDGLHLLFLHLSSGLLWALVTPLIVFVAERFPLVKPFRWQNVAVMLALAPSMAAFRAAIGGATQAYVEGARARDEIVAFTIHSVDVRLTRNIFIVVVVIGVVNLILAHRAAAASERRELALKREVANNELQRLRAAMQPRFLFAALDAVSTHAARNPHVADQMLVELGGVLRTMLAFGKRVDVSLGEELDFVERCVRLERSQTNDRFALRLEVAERLLAARVPPLLLHPITESVIQFDGRGGGRLHIEGWSEDHALRLLIRTDDPHRAPGATAIDATRARLQRAYGERASLTTAEDPHGVVTMLTLPLELRAL